MNHCRLIAIALTGVVLSSVGCVSQKHSDQQQRLLRRTQEQVIQLKNQLAECQGQIAAMRQAPPQQDPNMLNRLEAAIAERDRLAAALTEAQQALVAASNTTVLPAELDQQLVELAETNRALMQYDPQAGKLKLESDLTFALGSTEVSDQAKVSLQRLANIMATPSAGRYELHIVGHTDNVRIARAATLAKHPTNWHLSVHRAIAVKDILSKAGVRSERLMVAGHGEYRPIVPNGRKGAQGNRRVEIIVVPNTYTGPGLQSSGSSSGSSSSGNAGGSSSPAPSTVVEPFK